jgi:hypothetical protein
LNNQKLSASKVWEDSWKEEEEEANDSEWLVEGNGGSRWKIQQHQQQQSETERQNGRTEKKEQEMKKEKAEKEEETEKR